MATDLATSQALREELRAQGHMDCWPYKGPDGFDQATVYRCCVNTSWSFVGEWQKTRLSMKGVPTHQKLRILSDWRTRYYADDIDDAIAEACHVQVYNYLGALRRGGQLNDDNQVRKYI